ncbi:UvrD-helicase domain-containing protein [Nonomuraea cavernae]|uniref:UvrD-like helicase ATP-binding domain-containing protein n=1 Tax=Nonomuraea cavernae TaxID=2045107 RepID=A0A917ZAJ9_9ACTN|nr:UvrD-helicase domain-containing protein [Nonomuraea cavernae]MCA2187205.1 UvrD-helicase domain-containing protein [Nonomuraea cavernae]GGO78940.1 hypothetical protein GCM10012289_62080 [Nonomuraea cavernae]
MTESDLTDPQSFLVDANGSLFVEACPGAGKTKAIVARYIRRVTEERRKGIALVSFTNAAIDEVTDRCRDQPDSLVVPHFVGTFDAFINRFIVTPLYTRDYQRKVRFIESWNSLDDSAVRVRGQASQGLELEWFDFDHNGRARLNEGRVPGRSLGRAKKLMDSYSNDLCESARQKRARLIRAGVLSSSASRSLADRWLAVPRDRTRIGELLNQRFAEVIVDESQDCGREELEVLGLLREFGVDLVMVADLDQSIYAFRRAVPEKVLSFAATLPQGERLDGNFRSTPAICRITASVRGLTQVDHALGQHRELTVPVRLLTFENLSEVSPMVADIVSGYGIEPKNVALLAYRENDARQAAGGQTQEEPGTNRVLRIAAAGHVLTDPRSDSRSRLRARQMLEQTFLALAKTPSDDDGIDGACEKLGITQAWLSDVVVRMALTLSSHTGDAANYTKRIRAFLAGVAWPTTSPSQLGSLRTPTTDQWIGQGLRDKSSGLDWSTVHGAKGRQMPAVGMVIPKKLHRDEDNLTALDHWDYRTSSEAKRVLYVGVSRAERLLMLLVHKNHSARVAQILARDDVPYH